MTDTERLRAGDREAFETLVNELAPSMLRVARTYVATAAVAEEVVQETWLAVFTGIDRFEGRSTLKTWIFHILMNIARTRGQREHRTVPFATLAAGQVSGEYSADDAGRWPHHWATPPRRWSESPEQALEDAETLAVVRSAIAALPDTQRLTITMRDLEGWTSEEVCAVLELTAVNQRVQLHRARAKVREVLEQHLTAAQKPDAGQGRPA